MSVLKRSELYEDEWDHLNPLVKDKSPTGYISEISNLVPACGKCNQSKGNKKWKDWIASNAPLSPQSRGISDLANRIEHLERYEATFNPTSHDFAEMVGEELWKKHWTNYEQIIEAMKSAQEVADEIREAVRAYGDEQI